VRGRAASGKQVVVTKHREVETTYAPGGAAQMPDLTTLAGVHEARSQPELELSAQYFDTEDLALLRAGVTLRRRAGGADEGWHVKVPATGARDEIHHPLGRATTPPKAVRDVVIGWTRGAALVPIATVTTRRSPILLIDSHGEALAELADDHVTGATSDGDVVSWREWELELVSGSPDLLADADAQLAAIGIERAPVSRKVARVLGDRVPASPPVLTPEPDEPVARLVTWRLVEQVEALARLDVDARAGSDKGVHQMRVACRRLRALLASFRRVFDREQTDPIRDELHWLGNVLGDVRDPIVIHEQLRRLIGEEPRNLVHGPVLTELRSTYQGRGKPELRAALASPRYFALRDRLDRLVDDPPWAAAGQAPAREVAPRVLRQELARFRTRTRTALSAEDQTVAFHDVRKAAKRLRYAAETVEPLAGKPARRLARKAKHVTSILGELQDAVVTRDELLALAAAEPPGEPDFTYGRLHGREEALAEQLTAAYRPKRTLRKLESRTRRACAAIADA
jgi:CHAD domain-containing protein